MNAETRDAILLWTPVAVAAVVILVASSVPDPGGLPGGMSDKTGHLLGYGVLSALMTRALARGRLGGITWRRTLAALVVSSLYGVLLEWRQSFIPGRTSELLDVAANTLGALTGAAIPAGLKRGHALWRDRARG